MFSPGPFVGLSSSVVLKGEGGVRKGEEKGEGRKRIGRDGREDMVIPLRRRRTPFSQKLRRNKGRKSPRSCKSSPWRDRKRERRRRRRSERGRGRGGRVRGGGGGGGTGGRKAGG